MLCGKYTWTTCLKGFAARKRRLRHLSQHSGVTLRRQGRGEEARKRGARSRKTSSARPSAAMEPRGETRCSVRPKRRRRRSLPAGAVALRCRTRTRNGRHARKMSPSLTLEGVRDQGQGEGAARHRPRSAVSSRFALESRTPLSLSCFNYSVFCNIKMLI